MAKHYGIDGVGTLVELGKGGPKINNAAGVVEIKNNANNAYAIVRGASPVGADDLTTLSFSEANFTRYDSAPSYGFIPGFLPTLSFSDTTFQVTLTDPTGGWKYDRTGVRCAITGNKSIRLVADPGGNPAPSAGVYYVYTDAVDGTLVASTSTPWTLEDTKVPCAIVAWDDSATPKYHLADELHTSAIPRRYHWEHHFADGAELMSGGTTSGYTVNDGAPAGDTDNTFAIAETTFADEDKKIVNALLADPNGTDLAYVYLTRTGAATYGWGLSAVPFKYTDSGYINWNNGGTTTEGVTGKFYCSYLLATNFAGVGRYMCMSGRGEYASVSEAAAESIGLFNFDGFPIAECIVLYQFIWATDSTYTTKGKVRLAEIPHGLMISAVALMNQSQDVKISVLNDLIDVAVANPTIGSVVTWNGSLWIPGPPVTSSASAGIEWWPDTTDIIAKTTENAFVVETLGKNPVTTTESVEAIACTNNTVIGSAYLYNTALGRTTLDGGAWSFDVWSSVSSTNGGRVSRLTLNLYYVRPYTSPTVTITGSGTSRTVDASSGTPFASANIDPSATNTTASYLQTPKGCYQITARAGDTQVTIATPTGYGNESTVAFSVWKKFGGATTNPITALTTNYTMTPAMFARAAVTIEATDKLGLVVFGTSNNTTTVNYVYNGSTRYSRLSSPLVTLHNNLAGINAVGGNYQHLTDLQLSGLTGGTSTTLHSHAVPTTITVAAEASDQTCYPLFVTGANGDLAPKTHASFGFDALYGRLGIGTLVPLFPLHVGAGTADGGSVDAQVLVSRLANDTVAGNGHAFSDASVVSRSGSIGYNSYDAEAGFSGANNFNHYAAFQVGSVYNSSGTMDNMYGLFFNPTISAGTITNVYGVNVAAYAGAGAVTNTYGVYIAAQTKGATANYGIYAAGTAKNYFGGNVSIGSGAGSTWPLSINHATNPIMEFDVNAVPLGYIGNASSFFSGGVATDFAIQSNATGSKLVLGVYGIPVVVIDQAKNVGIGTLTPINLLHVSSDTNCSVSFSSCSDSASSNVSITRSRGTESAKTIVADADTVGTIWFSAYDGAAYRGAAKIYAVVSGTPGSADMPGKLIFATTADGANAPTDRVTIDQAGNLGVGTTVPSSPLHVYTDTDVWGIILGKVANSNIRFTGTSGGVDGIGAIQCYNNLTAKPLSLLPFGGNLLVGTTDDDGTPITGRLVVKGTTADGTTNIFVGRDSNEANVALLDTNGKLTLTGFGNAGTDTYIALTRTGGYGSTYLQQGYTATDNYLFGLDFVNDSRTLMSLRENALGGAGIQNRHVVTFPNAYRVGIGTATPNAHLHIVDDVLCELAMEAAYTHADYCPQINLKKCRTSIASPTIVASGDRTAIFGGMGYDGAAYLYTGYMEFEVDGTPGSNDMPGRFVLNLTPDGASAPVEVLRVNNAGQVGIGTNAPSYKLDVRASSTQASVTAASVILTTACTADASLVNTALNIDATSMAITAGVTDANSHSGIFTTVVGEGAGFAGTQSYSFGSRCYAGIGSTAAATAAVLNCYGGGFYCQNQKAGTAITNAYAVYANSKDVATGTISNAWDFYGASATSYNYFAGSVGVGIAVPAAKIHILKQTADAALPALFITGKSLYGTGDDDYGFAYYLGYNLTSNRQLIIVDTQSNYGLRFMSNYIDGFNKTAMDRMDLNLGSDSNGVHVGTPLANTQFSASNYNGTTTKIVCEILGANAQSGNFLNISSFATPNTGDILSVASTGNMFLGTTDVDGTPATGRLVVQGAYTDNTYNIFVGRDSNGANKFVLDCAGQITTGSWHATTLAYDHGGTGLTTYPTRTIILGANSASLGTTTPCTRATRELATNKQVVDSIIFPVSGVGIAWFSFPIPDAYDSGTFVISVYYYSVTSEAANFRFQAAMSSSADAEAIDVALGTTVLVTAACSGTALFQKVATFGAITASPTPAPGHMMFLKLWRDPDEGSDNSTLDAHVTALKIEFVASAWSD